MLILFALQKALADHDAAGIQSGLNRMVAAEASYKTHLENIFETAMSKLATHGACQEPVVPKVRID